MNICYICKAVDERNPTVASQVRWIRALASHPRVERVHVLARHLGTAELPANVSVTPFGAGGWARTVLGFYGQAARLRRAGVDFFLVAQGGPYPALLLPIKVALGRPVYQWKAHPFISRRMRFYARYCDDLIFTPTPSSFPMALETIRVVGHGIDTELFARHEGPKTRDLAIVGRIAAVKHHDLAIEAVALCRDRWGLLLTLDIVGPCAGKDEDYREQLNALIERRDLQDQVNFCGSVEHADLPTLLGQYRATMNLSDTAFDKAAGESMALGVPTITTNGCTSEVLPDDLRRVLVVEPDTEAVATAVRQVVGWDDATREEVARRLRSNVVAHHDLDSLFTKIIEAIDDHRLPAR